MTTSVTTDLPTGVVTFLITDIEGSTEILQRLGDELYAVTVERHNEILHGAFSSDGRVIHVTGDSFFAVFSEPVEALGAAVEAQRHLFAEKWPDDGRIKVRMGLHTGIGLLGGEDYVGLDVHRAARISAAGHGGQVLVSAETAKRVGNQIPNLVLRDLGPHRLKDLSTPEQLFQVVAAGLPDEFRPIQGAFSLFGEIPEAGTSFVGRAKEVNEIAELLGQHRLLTLTGPGGTGKTRLSMRVAAEAAGRFRDGAFFIELESLTDEHLIPTAVLKALNRPVTGSGDPLEVLATYLAGRQSLMILDNYEQLLPQVGVVSQLLRSAPQLSMVVTSRAPLHLSLEYEYAVPPMQRPSNGSRSPADLVEFESVQLFVERARSVRNDFAITSDNAAAVADLVRRLDGLPLAIELAASRVRIFTPREILARLSNRLLATGAADVPTRQQTISNAVGWSYELVDEPTGRFFARLSVFMGTASLNAIEDVCDPDQELGIDALDALTRLVDNSLVETVQDPSETRYQMLVVVREFAGEALAGDGDETEIKDRHMRFFSNLAARAEPFLLTSHQRKWLNILAVEHDNLRSAQDWALAKGETDVALRMTGDLWRFWQRRGHLVEGQMRAERSLEMSGGSPIALAKALEGLGGLLYWRGDWHGAGKPYLRSLELMREHGNKRQLANALYNAAFPLGYSWDLDRGESHLQESLELSKGIGDRLGVGRAYWGLCDLTFFRGDYAKVIELARRAEQEFEGLDTPFDLGWARFMVAHASYLSHDPATARRYIDAALPLFVDAGDVSALTLVMYVKAGIIEAEGDETTAAYLLGAIEVLIDLYGAGLGEVEENQYGPLLALKRSDKPEIVDALAKGRSLSEDEVIELSIKT
jgi:predicted ATPase/class 3 adenylate cyclase